MKGEGASDVVLALNSGSSSMKFALFDFQAGERLLSHGAVEHIGAEDGNAWRSGDGGTLRWERKGAFADHAAALDMVFSLLDLGNRRPGVIGHRIVHGGPLHGAPARVDARLLEELRAAVPFAPLHLPPAIAGIEAAARRFPGAPQVACFDTAFHATMPEIARRLPLPQRFHEEGIRRYGFHGLSYEYIMSELGDARPSRIIIAHLGSGASLVAVRDGRSVDTTMGLTPAGGILMGTRTGDIDPGVMIYLARQKGLTPDALEGLVDREAGLSALGGTSDMKTLIARAATDSSARLAIEMFGYAVRKAIGALAFALGGVELLVFTGGIGENVPEVRALACRDLATFGLTLDLDRNARGEGVVSADASRCMIRVIATDEDRLIARRARQWLLGR